MTEYDDRLVGVDKDKLLFGYERGDYSGISES